MKTADHIVKFSRTTQRVPWTEVEPLFNRVRNELDLDSDAAISRAIGLGGKSGSGSISAWRGELGAPAFVIHALRGLLSINPKEHPPQVEFNIREMELISTALSMYKGHIPPGTPDLAAVVKLQSKIYLELAAKLEGGR